MSAGAGFVFLLARLAPGGGQQALKQQDLGAAELPREVAGPGALLGLGQALLRRLKLLPQPGVLRGQLALPGLGAGQLLLQAGHGLPEPGVIHFLCTQAANLLQRNGMNGADLAHSIFVLHGAPGLLSVKKFPREVIEKAMLAHPQIGPVLEMMKDDFIPFMEEFYEYDPAKVEDDETPDAASAKAA